MNPMKLKNEQNVSQPAVLPAEKQNNKKQKQNNNNKNDKKKKKKKEIPNTYISKGKFKFDRAPTTSVTVFDMPGRIQGVPFMDIPSDPATVISDVGPPIDIELNCWNSKISAYELRKHQLLGAKTPSECFGKINLGQTYSMMLPEVISIPAVDTSLVVHPQMTSFQNNLLLNYDYVRARAVYILHIPMPFGASVVLEVAAMEHDRTSKPRVVRWTPAAATSIAFSVGWNNDISFVPKNGRPGQSGLSIQIKTVSSNNSESVVVPLKAVVFSCVYNISGYRLNSGVTAVSPSWVRQQPVEVGRASQMLNFPDIEEDVAEWEQQMDEPATSEVNIDAAASTAVEEAAAVAPPAPSIEKPLIVPNQVRARKTINVHSQAMNARWVPLKSIIVSANNGNLPGPFQPVLINDDYPPIKPGDNMWLSWFRYRWFTGSNESGFNHVYEIKAKIHRTPAVSGILEVHEQVQDVGGRLYHAHLIDFSSQVTFSTMLDVFARPVRTRHYNSPWVRTLTDYFARFNARVLIWNSTSEINDLQVNFFIRPGQASFSAPTKPIPRPQTTVLTVEKIFELVDFVSANYVYPELEQQMDDCDENETNSLPESVQNFITPVPYNEDGEIDSSDEQEDELEQDDFLIEIHRGSLIKGEPYFVPINPALALDVSSNNQESTVTQKCERFVNIMPNGTSPLGPTVGEYVVHTRLPTSVAGTLERVCLPDDMQPDVALMSIFGLSGILDFATSAISSIGGPLLGGLLNTGIGMIGNVLGIGGGDTKEDNNTATANPVSVSGPIPVPRYMRHLRPIAENIIEDPIGSTLALLARDDFNTDDPIDFSVFYRPDISFQRHVTERTVTPMNSTSTRISNKRIWRDRGDGVVRLETAKSKPDLVFTREALMIAISMASGYSETWDDNSPVVSRMIQVIKLLGMEKEKSVFYLSEINETSVSPDEFSEMLAKIKPQIYNRRYYANNAL